MYRILIVEDDQIITSTIQKRLNSWGIEAREIRDFKNVLAEFSQLDPHLVLMDISLPFFNGYHWCNEIRRISKVPIIFLSSMADNMNIVMAMNMGADDFIAKPFDMEVLVAKVSALLRRTYDFATATGIVEVRGAILNTNDASLTYQEQKVELTKNEFRILQVLMEQKGRVISRDLLMTKLWETDSYVDDNTLTVNVTRLRKKLEDVGLVQFILTKKGMGYLIEE